jgi:uncharacterized membrane protein
VRLIALTLIVAVAALHLYFLVLEMFLWTGPVGRRTFRMTADFAESTKTLAATVNRRILLVQALPAMLAGGFLWLA